MLYFNHDVNARNHRKIKLLENTIGQDTGYSMYFKTLEIMTEYPQFGIPNNEKDISDVAICLGYDKIKYKEFIDYCINEELFIINADNIIVADMLVETMLKVKTKHKNYSKAAQKREKAKAKEQHNSATILPQPEQKPENSEAAPLTQSGQVIKDYLISSKPENVKHTINYTNREINRFADEFDQPFMEKVIDKLYAYYNKGKKPYKSDNLATRDWVVNAVKEKGFLPCPPDKKRYKGNVILSDDDYKELLTECMNGAELMQYITQYSQTKNKYKDISDTEDCNNLLDYIAKKKGKINE